MSTTTGTRQPPLGVRLLYALRREPDWLTMSSEELIAFREAQNRIVASGFARVFRGFPDRRATIGWQHVTLPDRVLPVRVYRPASAMDGAATRSSQRVPGGPSALPLVLHVHGGGYVGTAVQCDWINSHLAAHLPAVVVSVEHRLI